MGAVYAGSVTGCVLAHPSRDVTRVDVDQTRIAQRVAEIASIHEAGLKAREMNMVWLDRVGHRASTALCSLASSR
jgi:UDP-glucose 6-dehydrogenase